MLIGITIIGLVNVGVIYYSYCLNYLNELGNKKVGNIFSSEDGASLPSFLLYSFIIFPVIVMPMIIIKRLFRATLGKFRVKFISITFKWLLNAFVRIFTLSWKATVGFLKNA